MGRPIVYCDTCGERILEEQVLKGSAVSGGGRYLCPKCRPRTERVAPNAPAPMAPCPTRTAPPRPYVPPPRPKSKMPIILGGTFTGIALVGVLVFALAGRSSPPPSDTPQPSRPEAKAPEVKPWTAEKTEKKDPAPAPVDERRALIEQLERFAEQNPDKSEEILARCKSAESMLQGTEYFERLRKLRLQAREKIPEPEVATKGEEKPAPAREPEKKPDPSSPKAWFDLADEAYTHYKAREYDEAKRLYLQAMPLLPDKAPRDAHEAWWYYAPYNLASIFAMDCGKVSGAAKTSAADECRRWLKKALDAGYTKRKCRCHGSCLEHFRKDSKFDAVRGESWFKDLVKSVDR